MDVRCEKCQTEYELDEGKLKPGGVTVKCTTCGHMFKVRRRPSGHASSSIPLPPDGASVSRAPLSDGDDGDRTWLVRLEDGEIKTCRELSTLQKWIVSGRVTRECAISRTGKKWKPLGEIGELASFFAIADEARQARASGKWGGTVTKEYPKEEAKSGGHPRTVPRRSSSGGSGDQGGGGGGAFSASAGRDGAPVQDLLDTLQDLKPVEEKKAGGAAAAVAAAGMNPIFARTLPLGTPLPPGMRSGNATGRSGGLSRPAEDAPTISSPEESAALARAAEQASEALIRPAYGSPAPAAPAPAQASPGPSTAGWASQGRVPGEVSSGESGPTAGIARPSRAGEAAFVSAKQAGNLPEIRGEYENGRFVPTYYTDDEIVIPRGNRAALWIILISLVLLAGAAIAVYAFLYPGGDDEEAAAQKPAAAAIDAGAAATAPSQPTAPPPALDQAVAGAAAAVAADADAGLEAAAENLAGLASQPGASASGPFQVARARVENALAQKLADQARLAATPAQGKPLADKARARAGAAKAAADAALAIEGDHKAAAQVALADAERLAGEKTVEVERILRQARQGPPAASADVAREADLVAALLLVRDERLRDARLELEQVVKQAAGGDVRARFRLAWLDFLDGNPAGARAGAEAILSVQPEHVGAKALLDKLGAPAAPGETKPGDKPPAEKPPAEKPPAEKPPAEKPPAEETTGSVLKRANKLAENGNCDGAMPLFRKVLDDNPSSVEALTGLGFCHLDRKEYASAHTRFRAALGISSRYQDAMWGIAELYQRQGNKEEAIAKYQEFIDAFPTTRRAAAARRQIEKLRGDSGEPSGGGGGESPGEETSPPPDPQVAPGSGDETR